MTASSSKINARKAMATKKDSAIQFLSVDVTSPFVSQFPHRSSCLETMISIDKLPRFSGILNRTETEGVDLDDLDPLQLELEALLSATVLKSRIFEKEIDVFNFGDEDSNELREECDLSSTEKPADIQNKLLNEMKEVSSKSYEGLDEVSIPNKHSKIKKFNDVPKHEEKLPQNSQRKYEPANKFWTSMNPFYTDISYKDLKFLEELIEKYENNKDILKIPLLGRHYSERWAEEELMNEQFESHSGGKARAKRTVTSMESSMLLKKVKHSISGPTTKPLADRCISALLEENIEVPQNESKDSYMILGENKICKSTSVSNRSDWSSLEERILRALEDEGIVDSSFQHSDSDDEILQEIKNCRTEIEVINNFNVTNLKLLLKLAKDEVTRQDLRRKIEMVDNKVLENYRLVLAAKQKNVPLSKTLKEQCWNSLKERDELKIQFDSLSTCD